MATEAEKPSSPVISIDASMLEQLPLELRISLENLYDEQERAKAENARLAAKAYQTELAETLQGEARWFKELDTDPDDGVSKAYIAAVDKAWRDFGDGSLMTVHRFYFDLYGIMPGYDPEDFLNTSLSTG